MYYFCLLTSTEVSWPTNTGTTIPGMVATVLVIAIKVPAKLGAMSMWLDKNPQNIPMKKMEYIYLCKEVNTVIIFHIFSWGPYMCIISFRKPSHRKSWYRVNRLTRRMRYNRRPVLPFNEEFF